MPRGVKKTHESAPETATLPDAQAEHPVPTEPPARRRRVARTVIEPPAEPQPTPLAHATRAGKPAASSVMTRHAEPRVMVGAQAAENFAYMALTVSSPTAQQYWRGRELQARRDQLTHA